MSDQEPIHSASWTGPPDPEFLDRQLARQRWQLELKSRSALAKSRAKPVSPEMSGLIATSLFLFLTPILLFCAGLALRFSIRDQFLNDNAIWLYGWGFAAVAIAILGMIWRSTLLLGLRRFVAATALLATVLFSGAYIYLGLAAYGGAQKTEPERTFELARSCGRKCAQLVHQRVDGSTVEGLWAGPAVPYGNCTLVQRLDGEHGFRWVRVLERSRGDGSNLAWPIRREECFGTKPVSSLHG